MDDHSLLGIHHVSAITGEAPANLRFYTEILGLRLVAKTVNQDDPTSYHLFYGDETGTPGTELTFFDIPRARSQRPGTGLISGTSLRVRGRGALEDWAQRLDDHDVRRTPIHERAGRAAFTFYDDEGQTLHLVDDERDADRVPDTQPWTDGPVSVDVAIRGLGPVELTVSELEPMGQILTDVFGFRKARSYEVNADPVETNDDLESVEPLPSSAAVFETGPGGVAAEVHVVPDREADPGRLGTGGVHHFALRTPNGDTIRRWREQIVEAGLDPSPVIDRHYFESVYTRVPPGILIEIATDTGHPFPLEEAAAGTVTLPPKLEPRREAIEARLTPLGSVE